MHRNKAVYGDDADDFNPDRWEALKVGWDYIPFNGGPRICVGQQFALTEAGYTTVRLMQLFEIENRDKGEYEEGYSITNFVGNGVNVGMTRRKA
jgi:cytochrome P450